VYINGTGFKVTWLVEREKNSSTRIMTLRAEDDGKCRVTGGNYN
jgi:hypothetical protein